ncbi:MAG TPA: glycosyltransferase [Tepidisphaeraceae bacterium]|nr:glycosyltransferase [Tepidisphaeraceae bacterium]
MPDTVVLPNSKAADPRSALRGRDMLCFSHDWNGDPLSKTHLMRLLAKDNRILWVNSIGYRTPTVSKRDLTRALKKLAAFTEPIREVEPNIHVLNPLALPFHGPAAQELNRRLLKLQIARAMRKLEFQKPLSWIFNPAAAVIAGTLGEDYLIYYCVDEYTAFTGVASESLANLEKQLLAQSDLVIVSAQKLYDSKAPHNPNTILVRHGVDYAHFRRALDLQTRIPAEIANLPRPIIGFFGLIADWVDVELMARVARRFSRGSLVVLGKQTTDISALQGLTNVHIFGRKDYSELPAYCKGFDVAINPFRINTLTLNANPLKVREYLAAGLPVVSTAIPEVEALGQCRIGHDDEEFIREIELALNDPRPRSNRSDAIASESWDARLDVIARRISEAGR